LFQGLLSNKIYLTPSEWKALVENPIDGVSLEGRMMRCLARVPDFMKRGKMVRNGEVDDLELLDEAKSNYQTVQTDLKELHDRLDEAKVSNEPLNSAFTLHAYYERIYGIGLAVGIILNCVLSAIDNENTALALESERFSEEIIALSEPAKRYRPLWSSYMIMCLMAAWIGTTDSSVRLLAERALEGYQCDFPQRHGPMMSMTMFLKQTHRQLYLLD
jgi:hypothetical protein